MTMHPDDAGGRSAALIGALALLLATACGEGGRTEYLDDGDTGAAAPATTLDQNTAERLGADSTLGVGGRTGEGAVAGDTTGAVGRPVGRTDSAAAAALTRPENTPPPSAAPAPPPR